MNRRKLFGMLAVAPFVPLAAEHTEHIVNIDARGMSDELLKRLPEILAERDRKLLATIQDQMHRGALL